MRQANGNIYLTGMMGSGKSVTGKRLARLLGFGFIDLDGCIEQKTRSSISDIFETKGEAYFREIETECLEEVSKLSSQVVATGGGILLRASNIEGMRRSGIIVYLRTSMADLLRRLKEKDNRPLLKNGNLEENLNRIWRERRALYESICDFEVDTNGETADSVAQKIYQKLETLK
ncbi:MAG: shikimate kinase [Candidatus Omnitrophica bacterium]|nr:shikimate kinase [Candidatus Omnitrophota bacterium]